MRYILPILILLAVNLDFVKGDEKQDVLQKKELDLNVALNILQKSKDPEELEKTAMLLCRSTNPKALSSLVSIMLDPAFLYRLDDKDDYKISCELRISKILMAIGESSLPMAEESLLKLVNNKGFMAEPCRVVGIIDATGWIQKPSSKLLDFLDSQAEPQSGYTGSVIRSLSKTGSPEAVSLIEKRILSPDYDLAYKKGWLHSSLITVRNTPAIVNLFKRLIKSEIKNVELREMIVETLFDYKFAWYGITEGIAPPRSPDRREASTAVLVELLNLADLSLKLDISKEAKESVLKGKKEVVEICNFRKAGGLERVARWIAELDSDQYAVRNASEKELEKVLDMAEPALRKALTNPHSPEVRIRLERILSKIKKHSQHDE